MCGFTGDTVVLGDNCTRQQLQGPPGTALRWLGRGGRDQHGFLFARELQDAALRGAPPPGCRAQSAAWSGRRSNRHAHAGRDFIVAGPRGGGHLNSGSLEPTRRVLAAAQKRREFGARFIRASRSCKARTLKQGNVVQFECGGIKILITPGSKHGPAICSRPPPNLWRRRLMFFSPV